ncbi:MAG: PQQ-dependent sugar dehydrogenase [Verrucomicrobiota bacterium]
MGRGQCRRIWRAGWSARLGMVTCLVLGILASWGGRSFAATLPAGFIEEPVGGGWSEAVGLTFDNNGRMYVWERAGRIWIVENGVKLSPPLIDIHEEVGGWRDYGLLGVALHPNFEENGHIYLLYVVDRHHLTQFGTPNYHPDTNHYFAATIGRLTRYTARAADGFRSVDPASRRVLVGESITTGFPIMHQSHGTGSLVFGTDGTLLATAGDGASYDVVDTGGTVGGTYTAQALADGIIKPKEDVGAYRSQLVDSLAGKIVRVDPETGDGVPGNPFYDPASPRAPRSRVWALGLRNPFRMTLRPGTGSHLRDDANPGALYLGDVGWNSWEELNVATRGAVNFGWPAFEGMTNHTGYFNSNVSNRDAPNPLYGSGGCAQQYFYFRNLIVQDTLNPNPWFPNPCNSSQSVPASIPHFVHTRPVIDWRQTATGPSRTATYDANGNATFSNIGASGSPVTGPQFGGECSVGGVWYTGTDFPAQYRNTYFHGDYVQGWIRSFTFDQSDRPVSVRNFLSNASGLVAIQTHPAAGGLYYIRWGSEVRRISYAPGGNQPPTAIASADRYYGPTPLTVQFTGSNSTDPEGSALQFVWDFGDGSLGSTAANPAHTFLATSGVPTQYTVTLTVTDAGGASAQTTVVISVNNTPPNVAITSPVDGTKYSMQGDTVYPLTANVTDAEHPDSQLAYQWQTILHHNTHQHTEAVDTRHTTSTVISPVGCDGELYFYRVVLTVTDPAGLSSTNEVRLYPNCDGSGGTADVVWVDDAVPAGAYQDAQGGDAWTWVSSNPAPYSGTLAHQSALIAGTHQHYFDNATATLAVGPGDALCAYVYLDAANPPGEVMLQWNDGSWEHRAYWGANSIPFGANGTPSRYYAGVLPPAGQWVRLQVPANAVGLEGRTLKGMAFTLYGGRATWDYAGRVMSAPATMPAVSITAPANGATVSGSSVAVSADASDNAGVLGVQFKLDGANLGAEDTTAPYGIVWDTTSLPNGSHTLTAVARDGDGNQTTSNPVTVTVSNGSSATTVWFDDTLPAGASAYSQGDDSWNWVGANPAPFSGSLAHQSDASPGLHQHYFDNATGTLSVGAGDSLFVYAYIDPASPPSELMVQWNNGNWEHRAYWGANFINWGTDGTASRRYLGPVPAAGQWVRLEVPAGAVGLEGSVLKGMAFTLYNGRVTWDYAGKTSSGSPPPPPPPPPPAGTTVWVDDDLPAGAVQQSQGDDTWNWVSNNPTPYSGGWAHQSTLLPGMHQHYFYGASETLAVSAGDVLFTYVYIDPANPPSEIMLQWNSGNWEHRAYWGVDAIFWGTDGTASRRFMGPLPSAGQWVRLEVPASAVGLEGHALNGMAFTLYDGRVTWDYSGKSSQ